MSALVVFHHGSIPKVLLLEHASDGVLVLEDEVHFVGRAALVGAEHDGVGAASVERLLAQLRLLQQLDIGAVAAKAVGRIDLILEHEVLRTDLQEAG